LLIFVNKKMRGQCVVLGNQCNVIDLSYPLDENTIFWPGGEGFNLCMNCCKSEEYGYDYAAGKITCSEHGGTHVDAPFHFNAKGKFVDQIPITDLVGPCKIIDIKSSCNSNPNYTLGLQDIINFENEHGQLQNGDLVLIRTGWHSRYSGGPAHYLGFDEKINGPYSNSSVLRFPAIGKEAAEILVARQVTAVGLDTGKLSYNLVGTMIFK
jgi:kynurenine formamidase